MLKLKEKLLGLGAQFHADEHEHLAALFDKLGDQLTTLPEKCTCCDCHPKYLMALL
jgi:hypothetical protein